LDAGQAFLLVETAAIIFMAGVLWTMQRLNYPLLSLVGRDAFTRYETAHNRRFGLVVFPGVLAAPAGATGLLASRPSRFPPGAGLRAGSDDRRHRVDRGPARTPPSCPDAGLRRADPSIVRPPQLDPGHRLAGRAAIALWVCGGHSPRQSPMTLGSEPSEQSAVQVYRGIADALTSGDPAKPGRSADADSWLEARTELARHWPAGCSGKCSGQQPDFGNPTVRSQRWAKR
jgi:hypothetical protein